MANETRINKYKNLRDTLKEEDIDEKPIKEEDQVIDDDFLSFLPHEEKKDELHPLSYDTMEDDEIVKSVINEAKINVGKDQYNTRADILNRIRNDECIDEPTKVYKKEDLIEKVKEEAPVEPTAEEEKTAEYTVSSLDQDNAKIRPFSVGDPEEDEEESEEPLSRKEIKARKKAEKKKLKEEKKTRKQEREEDDAVTENKGNRFVSVLLDIIIFVLLTIFIGLCVLYVRDLPF